MGDQFDRVAVGIGREQTAPADPRKVLEPRRMAVVGQPSGGRILIRRGDAEGKVVRAGLFRHLGTGGTRLSGEVACRFGGGSVLPSDKRVACGVGRRLA
jgi:hypothetical protein